MVDKPMFELKGPLKSVHQFVDMTVEVVEYKVPETGEVVKAKGCKPAMGHTFSSGTIDGPGLFSFETGSKSSNNPLWNLVKNVVPEPSLNQTNCHAEKSILISTGEVSACIWNWCFSLFFSTEEVVGIDSRFQRLKKKLFNCDSHTICTKWCVRHLF